MSCDKKNLCQISVCVQPSSAVFSIAFPKVNVANWTAWQHSTYVPKYWTLCQLLSYLYAIIM